MRRAVSCAWYVSPEKLKSFEERAAVHARRVQSGILCALLSPSSPSLSSLEGDAGEEGEGEGGNHPVCPRLERRWSSRSLQGDALARVREGLDGNRWCYLRPAESIAVMNEDYVCGAPYLGDGSWPPILESVKIRVRGVGSLPPSCFHPSPRRLTVTPNSSRTPGGRRFETPRLASDSFIQAHLPFLRNMQGTRQHRRYEWISPFCKTGLPGTVVPQLLLKKQTLLRDRAHEQSRVQRSNLFGRRRS